MIAALRRSDRPLGRGHSAHQRRPAAGFAGRPAKGGGGGLLL